MPASSADLFEVVTAAANAAARRLTTAEYVLSRLSSAPSTTEVNIYIDEVSEKAAKFCDLAADAIGTPPTFASETLRATWNATCSTRGSKLLLPWRIPVTSITSIVEAGTALAASAYQLAPGPALKRMSGDYETCWSSGKIVLTYVAGWATLSTNAPQDLQAAVAEQIKYLVMTKSVSPALRSATVDELRTESYNVPGGDSVNEFGLIAPLASLLDHSYRNKAFV